MGESRGESGAAYAKTSLAISNLRGVFIVILVSFHSCLAYLGSTPGPAASFDQPPYPWLAFPIVDDRRFFGFDLYSVWVDINVMSMMYLLSGLFVATSLRRKGPLRFAWDRLQRLGLPFLFNVFALMPIAIYPVYHRLAPDAGIADYATAYFALPFFPNGQTWFLWILIAWSLLAAAIVAVQPNALERLGEAASGAQRNPKRFLAGLLIAAAVAYLPPTLAYGPFDWIERGLFSFQISRPLLYGVYFFAGVAIGAHGLGAGLLTPDGGLARLWTRLAVASPVLLFAWMGLTGVTVLRPEFAPWPMSILSGLAYVGASVAGVTLMLALAVRFCAKRIVWQEPLSRNALGIFVIHYAPMVWMQYLLTDVPLPGFLKAAIVFGVTLPASLGVAMLMRKQSLLARLIGEEGGPSFPMPPPRPSRA